LALICCQSRRFSTQLGNTVPEWRSRCEIAALQRWSTAIPHLHRRSGLSFADIICCGITSEFFMKRKKKKGKPGRVSCCFCRLTTNSDGVSREALPELLQSIQLVSDSTPNRVAVVAFCLSSMMIMGLQVDSALGSLCVLGGYRYNYEGVLSKILLSLILELQCCFYFFSFINICL